MKSNKVKSCVTARGVRGKRRPHERTLTWGVSSESHRLSTKVLGSCREGRWASLAVWRNSGTNRRVVGSLACLWAMWRKVCSRGWQISWDHLVTHPSQANKHSSPTACLSAALDPGWPQPRRRLDHGTQSLGYSVTAIVGIYQSHLW